MFFFLVWLHIPSSTCLSCPAYSCSLTPFTNGTCIINRGVSYTLYPCYGAKSYCPTDFTGQFSLCTDPIPAPSPDFPYIGEACSPPALPCLQGDCLNGICRGKSKGASCVSSDVCDVGLRCVNTRCVDLMQVGEWGCMNDTDCEVNSGCNFLQGRFYGQCTYYFSLFPGAQTTDCVSGRSHLCHSTYCQSQANSPYPLDYCIEAPVLSLGAPGQCQSDDDCVGISRPWKYPGKCVCGRNEVGMAICEAFEGDMAGIEVRNTLKDIMLSSAGTCHTSRRLTSACYHLLSPALTTQLQHQQLFFTYYPLLQYNDPCVQRIYTNFYWQNAAIFLTTFLVLITSF